MKTGVVAVALAASIASMGSAQEVALRDGQTELNFTVNGQSYTITRDQNTSATLTGEFARTSRPCPDFCIQPMIPAPGIEPVAELEILDFLSGPEASGQGLLIDARLPEWHAKGTLPGAVNVPFTALDADNPYKADILRALGATGSPETLNFDTARELIVFGNGPWDEQGSRAIKNLIDAGYPVRKIKNYRGGVQAWSHLGLTLTQPTP